MGALIETISIVAKQLNVDIEKQNREDEHSRGWNAEFEAWND